MPAKKVLIAISEAGGGHRSVAEAIRCALVENYAPAVEVEIFELSRLSGSPLIISVPELYSRAVRKYLPMYDLMWRVTDRPLPVRRMMQALYPSVREKLIHILRSANPDLVLIGNALLCYLFAAARAELGLDFPILVAVSDLSSIHTSWTSPEVDLSIVPTAEARQRLTRIGIPPAKVVETEFPIHPKYLRYRKSQAEARAQLGLDPGCFTLLLTGGGAGSGLLERYVEILQRGLPDLQLLVVTGSNQEAYRELSRQAVGKPMRVYTYVANMEDLIAASDLVVTKAGPSTMMECLALGRPQIITRTVGAQERGNIEYMLRYPQVSFHKSGKELLQAVKDALETREPPPSQVVQPCGAYQIAEIVMEWLAA